MLNIENNMINDTQGWVEFRSLMSERVNNNDWCGTMPWWEERNSGQRSCDYYGTKRLHPIVINQSGVDWNRNDYMGDEVAQQLLDGIKEIIDNKKVLRKIRTIIENQRPLLNTENDVVEKRKKYKNEKTSPEVNSLLNNLAAEKLFMASKIAKDFNSNPFTLRLSLSELLMNSLEHGNLNIDSNTKTTLLNCYGTSETLAIVIASRPNREKIGSTGKPIDNIKTKLVSQNGTIKKK